MSVAERYAQRFVSTLNFAPVVIWLRSDPVDRQVRAQALVLFQRAQTYRHLDCPAADSTTDKGYQNSGNSAREPPHERHTAETAAASPSGRDRAAQPLPATGQAIARAFRDQTPMHPGSGPGQPSDPALLGNGRCGHPRGTADTALIESRRGAEARTGIAEYEVEASVRHRLLPECAIGRGLAPLLVAAIAEIEQDGARDHRDARRAGRDLKAVALRPQPGLGTARRIEPEGRASRKADRIDGLHEADQFQYLDKETAAYLNEASDAGQDRGFQFDDLGNAVRKCQVDLGVRIDIRTSAIVPDPRTGQSLFHCAFGDITYPERDGEGTAKGLLLYIKPTLTGDEPPDVRQYAKKSPTLPHETTADQWFDESQFESYRKLGHHVLSTVLEPVRAFDDLESRFVNLKQRWYPPSRTASATFARHGEKLQQVETALRSQPELKFLDGQLFPEWSRLMAGANPPTPVWLGLPSTYEERRAGFYVCTNMLQLMENVYLDVNLEVEMDHPDNRGWINLFRHWSWSAMFMATCSICCGMSGARFQLWCERHLNLYPGQVKLDVHDRPDADGDVAAWLADLERRGLVNFVEAELLGPENGHARAAFGEFPARRSVERALYSVISESPEQV
jgi:hypothetical protein